MIRNIQPKYACPGCKAGVAIAVVPVQLLPKSLATPSLLAHIATAKFVDALPLYRQETQFARLGVTLRRATMAGWMIRLDGLHVVPLINLLNEQMLAEPLIHCDETRLQVLRSDKAPGADHWVWVRASGPPGWRLILFDYDASWAGAVPRRLLEGYRGILLSDGYEAHAAMAEVLQLVHAGCFAHVRRKSDEAHKTQGCNGADSLARVALEFIRELYRVEKTLWDRDQPISPEQRLDVRAECSAPVMAKFQAWLEALAPQVLPQSSWAGVPSSDCFKIPVICSTENRFLFTTKPPSRRSQFCRNPHIYDGPNNRGPLTPAPNVRRIALDGGIPALPAGRCSRQERSLR